MWLVEFKELYDRSWIIVKEKVFSSPERAQKAVNSWSKGSLHKCSKRFIEEG